MCMFAEDVPPTKEAGDGYYKKGEFEDAVTAYSGAIAADKKNHILHSNRAAAYLALGDFKNALTDAAECVRLDPTFLKGYLRKGQALAKLLLFEAAVANYEEAIVLFPDDQSLKQALQEALATKNSLPESLVNAKASTIGHSSLLVGHIVAFMRHRKKIGALWDSIRKTGDVEAIESIDQVSVTTGDGFNGALRQVTKTGNFVGNMSELYETAALAQPVFNALISQAVVSIPDCRPDMVHLAPLKGRERATAKAKDDYSGRTAGPGEAWLFDIVRASVECETEAQIAAVVAQILASPNVEVIRLKNRFRNPTPAGFRDVNMNIKILMPQLGAGVYHICELQVHHKEVKDFAKKNHSHSHYEYFRVYFSGSVDSVDQRLTMFEELQAFDEEYTDRKSRSEGPGPVDDDSILVKATKKIIAGDDMDKLEHLAYLLHIVEEHALHTAVTRRIIEVAEKRPGHPVDRRTIKIKNELGASLQIQLLLGEAKAIFEEILRDIIPKVHYDHEAERMIDSAVMTQSLALVLLDMGDLAAAENILRPSLALIRQLRGDNHVETAYCHHNYGLALLGLQRAQEAAFHLGRAVEIRRAEFGDKNLLLASSMIRYAEALGNMRHFAEAKAIATDALEISKRVGGDEDRNTLNAMGVLGNICNEQGDLDQALFYFQKTRELYMKMLGTEHINIAAALMNESSIYLARQNWPPAHSLLVKAIEICNRYFKGQPHHIAATGLNNLGCVYLAQMQFAPASKYFQQALEMRQQVLGPNHIHTGKVHGDLGASLNSLGQLDKAAYHLEEALRVYKLNNVAPLECAVVMNSMGPMYQKLGRFQDAANVLQEALKIFREVYPENHQTVATVYNNLGTVYRDLNMLPEAEKFLTAAVNVFTATFGQANLNTMNIMGNLGTVLIKYPDPAKSKRGREMINATLRFLTAAGFDANHPYVIKFMTALQQANSGGATIAPAATKVSLPMPTVAAGGAQKMCINRHVMTAMNSNVPEYSAMGGNPQCDKCSAAIVTFTTPFYHCSSCGYDLCANCSSV
jgi:tetratricopeptide (TPR) repeat protein